MSFPTIILFLIYTYGLGFSATAFVKMADNAIERHLMRIGIGLGIFPILAIILNFSHIPLDWRIFLFLSLVGPLFLLYKRKFKVHKKLRIRKSDLFTVIIIFLFLLTLQMYLKGAFGYPYLEDTDPYGHAVGVRYVSLEKNAFDPEVKADREIDAVLSFIDPYPPAYDILMGVLHQTSSSMKWTLKFFNALIISLGVIFFYFFSFQLIGDRNKALFATFIFTMIPCYLSHFIWAHSLVITIFFPLMYSLIKIQEDKRWAWISALIFASVWVSQHLEQPIKISILIGIYLIVMSVTHKKLQKEALLSIVGGFLLSLVWWLSMVLKYGWNNFIAYYGVAGSTTEGAMGAVAQTGIVTKIVNLVMRMLKPGGTAGRPYLFSDFFTATKENLINNPIGIGVIICILVAIGVVYLLFKFKFDLGRTENSWLLLTLFWLTYTFLAVNGVTFNIYVGPGSFRVWMLMAIPLALVTTIGYFYIYETRKEILPWALLSLALLLSMIYTNHINYSFPAKGIFFFVALILSIGNCVNNILVRINKSSYVDILAKSSIVIIVFLGVLLTSGFQKYSLNTAPWGSDGSFISQEDAFEYAKWFSTIPPKTNVFLYSPRDKLTIGLDGHSCMWCQNVLDFRKGILNRSISDVHSFLKKNKYEYFIIGTMDFKYLGTDNESTALLQKRIQEVSVSPLFKAVYQAERTMVVFKIL